MPPSNSPGKDTRKTPPPTGKADPGPRPGGVASLDSAVAMALIRDTYVRERHYLLMRVMLVCFACLLVSVGLNAWLVTRPPLFKYFPTNNNGTLAAIVPLNQALDSDSELTQWFVSAIVESLSFDFVHFRAAQSKAEENFTDSGWRKFQDALAASKILLSVQDNRFVVSTVTTAPPVILNRGTELSSGVYKWRLQVPILISYQAEGKPFTQALTVTAVVAREPQTEHPRGLGIEQIVVN